MEFEWDPEKAEANLRKHGVLFSTDVLGVFNDDFAITISDESDSGERRFATIGTGTKGRVLVVIFTYRGDNIRLISARTAEPREREQYEEQR